MRKKLLLCVFLTAAVFALTGCTSGNDASSASLHVTLAATYVPEDAVTALETELVTAFPALNTEESKMVISGISMGDSEKDPEGTMAGMAKLMGMMASGEIQLLICDPDNARRYAENGESYIPISELFSEEELAASDLKTVSVPLLDEENNYTGEYSQPCGIDLSGSSLLYSNLYSKDMAAYVMINTTNVDNAKDVILHLASLN